MQNTVQAPIITMKSLITGAFPSKGTFTDDGKTVDYDSIKFYIQMPLVKGKGFATVESKLENRSHDYDKIFGNVELPAMAEISFVEQTDGKGKLVRKVTDILILKTNKENKPIL